MAVGIVLEGVNHDMKYLGVPNVKHYRSKHLFLDGGRRRTLQYSTTNPSRQLEYSTLRKLTRKFFL